MFGIDLNLQWYDFIRMATALSALVSMYLLIHTYALHKVDYTPKIMDRWLSKNLFLFAAFYSSLEAIVLNRPGSGTIVVMFLATAYALRSTLASATHHDEVPPGR